MQTYIIPNRKNEKKITFSLKIFFFWKYFGFFQQLVIIMIDFYYIFAKK